MPMDTAEVPLFHQPRILSKMVQFHSRLASLQILKCITCLERFPGITVSFLLYLCIPLQLHSIRMRQILPFAHVRPTMPCILLVIIVTLNAGYRLPSALVWSDPQIHAHTRTRLIERDGQTCSLIGERERSRGYGCAYRVLIVLVPCLYTRPRTRTVCAMYT